MGSSNKFVHMISPQRRTFFSITIEHYDMIQVPIESKEAKLFNGVPIQTPPAIIDKINAVQGRNLKHPNNFVGHCTQLSNIGQLLVSTVVVIS